MPQNEPSSNQRDERLSFGDVDPDQAIKALLKVKGEQPEDGDDVESSGDDDE